MLAPVKEKYSIQSIQQHDVTCLILVQLFLNTMPQLRTDVYDFDAIMLLATFYRL